MVNPFAGFFSRNHDDEEYDELLECADRTAQRTQQEANAALWQGRQYSQPANRYTDLQEQLNRLYHDYTMVTDEEMRSAISIEMHRVSDCLHAITREQQQLQPPSDDHLDALRYQQQAYRPVPQQHEQSEYGRAVQRTERSYQESLQELNREVVDPDLMSQEEVSDYYNRQIDEAHEAILVNQELLGQDTIHVSPPDIQPRSGLGGVVEYASSSGSHGQIYVDDEKYVTVYECCW